MIFVFFSFFCFIIRRAARRQALQVREQLAGELPALGEEKKNNKN